MVWTRALSGWWSVWSETSTGHPDRRTSHRISSALLMPFLDIEWTLWTLCVNPGAENPPLSLCLLWLWTLWISACRSSLQSKTIFSYHQASFRRALNGHLCVALVPPHKVVLWCVFCFMCEPQVQSPVLVEPCVRMELKRLTRRCISLIPEFSQEVYRTVKWWFCNDVLVTFVKLSRHCNPPGNSIYASGLRWSRERAITRSHYQGLEPEESLILLPSHHTVSLNFIR